MKELECKYMPMITVKNLSKRYEYYHKEPGILDALKSFFYREAEYKDAVNNISFDINEGELVGFLGPNGAGKTTTLKMLSGILTSSGGEARVLGFTPSERQVAYQKQFALVMGWKNQLIGDLPAIETICINKEIYGVPEIQFQKNFNELVEILGVRGLLNVQVRKLSLGERMKFELMAALIHNPKVLFLDEPTIGLDVVAQKSIRDFIKKYNHEKKMTIMLTSHYMEDIKELCERVIIINLGSIIYDGAIDELVKKYAPYKLLKITLDGKGVERGVIERYGELEEFTPYSCAIRVPRSEAKERAIKLLSSNIPVDDIVIDEPAIDDVVRKFFTRA